MKSKNGQGVPDSRKADEVRLYALRGGLKKQAVCYTHFHSNKVFRGDLIMLSLYSEILELPPQLSYGSLINLFCVIIISRILIKVNAF